MDLFYNDGRVKWLPKRIREYSDKYNMTIVEAVDRITDFKGYQYKGLFKYSFTDVREAYGVKQNGVDYIEWETHNINSLDRRHVLFVFEIAMGNGCAYPQPSGQFDLYLNGKKIISFTVVKYSNHWGKDGIRLYFEVKKKKVGSIGDSYTLDEWIQNDNLIVNGIGYLRVPSELLGGREKARIKIVPVNPEKSENWIRIGKCRSVLWCNIYQGLEEIYHGKKHPSIEGYYAYFGDIHTHSGQSDFLDTEGCGTGTWQENFEYARDIACLDFFCMTDHDWQMGRSDWKTLRELTDSYNSAGRFVALKGYEWTSYLYGHRNVYFKDVDIDEVLDFRTEKIPVRFGLKGSSPEDPTPQDLWNWLEENQLEAITVPHHSNADQFIMDLDFYFNEEYDRLIEIYSCWGSADGVSDEVNINNDKLEELAITKYLGRYRFGFIASSDGHDGHPGNASLCGGHRYFLGHPQGSGKAVVLAKTLDRDAVYEALKRRRCYAVTGAPIAMYFAVNGYVMGSEVYNNRNAKAEIKLVVQAMDKIKRVEIIKNGEIARLFKDLETMNMDILLEDNQFDNTKSNYYYVRLIQEDGEMAWASPVYFVTA